MNLQAWTSRIHPQVALNKHEARNLLKVLQSSFRKQLDTLHPAVASYQATHKGSPVRPQDEIQAPPSSKALTATHFHSLLSNPLFAIPKQDNINQRNDTLTAIRDPVAWFVNRVAQGSADSSAARLCLHTLLSSISKRVNDPVAVREALYEAKAGARVLQWMSTYGLRDLAEVRKDPELLALLIKPLVAENEHGVIERWLLDPSVRRKDGWRRLLFEHLVRAEVALGANLNKVIPYFWDISRRLDSTVHGSTDSSGSASRTAGLFITLRMIHPISIVSPDLYARWTESVGDWSQSPAFYHALLRIHDPVHPSAGPALDLLRDGDILESGRRMVRLCLDTAELLLAQENYDEASSVMQYAKMHFSRELGIQAREEANSMTAAAAATTRAGEQKKSTHHDVDERHHLAMLDQLSFG